ncbi:MAG: efflux RND transporter periplasmic adaptor subunit [Burkholderiaceae bacterium]|nr:MAG: efflux RND transporter periplasmic adaptor subunit [Burkholderiaceae bacterium]
MRCKLPSPQWTIAIIVAIPLLSSVVATHALAAGANGNDVVTVHAQAFTDSLRAYGQVEPIALIEVRVVNPGTLSALRVVPGSVVTAGEALARITGPRMHSLLTAREQALHSAQAHEDAASQALEINRRLFATQLATRAAINAAQAELAAARAAALTANAQLREAQDLQTLRAPTAGTVMAVRAADGEQTLQGETILTLQPAGNLWIRAAYYGTDAALLRVGMTGSFQPVDGGVAIPIEVSAIAPGVATDGGRSAGLVATSNHVSATWVNGQWGTVTLAGPVRQMVVVPTSALILDRGNWWVLAHTAQGDRPQKVVPGPTRGWQTWIASGLHPGQQVVAQDAFLEYHRGIAQTYQPPD